MGIVADASALFDYLVDADAPGELGQLIREQAGPLDIPHLCDAEISSIVRRHVGSGELDSSRAEDLFEDYLAMPLHRHSHESRIQRAFGLRPNFGAYDAVYITLADDLGARLLTTDRRLAAATRRHTTLELALG